MERWEKSPHRRSRSKHPSFSSSLLDAIYRSFDEQQRADDGNTDRGAPDCSAPQKHKEKTDLDGWPFPKSTPAVNRSGVADSNRRSSCSTPTFSSSSSYSTSTGTTTSSSAGFSSSSDAESVRTVRAHRAEPPAAEKKSKKSKNSKCGFQGLRKARAPRDAAAPASPGARLANFINALFSAAGSAKKTKIAAAATGGGAAAEDPPCSSPAPSCRRSCLSKAPGGADDRRRGASGTDAGKRSVRFYPVSVIVDEDSRPCGHKRLQDEAIAPIAARVEELLRVAGAGGEDEGEEEEGSESSSDLFELENLTVAMEGGCGGTGYPDELPVYETTDLDTNRAIAEALNLEIGTRELE